MEKKMETTIMGYVLGTTIGIHSIIPNPKPGLSSTNQDAADFQEAISILR